MGLFNADLNRVTFFAESGTYAVPSGTSGLWLGLVTSHEASENTNVQEIRYTGTGNRNVSQFVDGAKDFEGTITYHPQDWRMLSYTLGSCIDAGSPSPYTHVISESDSDDTNYALSGTLSPFRSFTVEDSKKSTTDGQCLVRKYNGCIIDSLSISASEGEPLENEVSYKAQAVTMGSKTTDISPIADEDTSRPYIFSDVKLHIPSGTVVQTVKDFSLTINNNLEPKHYLNGSKFIAIATPTMRDYELTATLDAESSIGISYYRDYYQSGTTFNALLEINQSTGSEACYIAMSGCKMTEMTSPTEAEGIGEFSLTIKPQSVSVAIDDLVYKYNAW